MTCNTNCAVLIHLLTGKRKKQICIIDKAFSPHDIKQEFAASFSERQCASVRLEHVRNMIFSCIVMRCNGLEVTEIVYMNNIKISEIISEIRDESRRNEKS